MWTHPQSGSIWIEVGSEETPLEWAHENHGASRGKTSITPGILNTWIGNEADIRLNYGIPTVLRLRAILRVAKSQKRKATLSKLVSF